MQAEGQGFESPCLHHDLNEVAKSSRTWRLYCVSGPLTRISLWLSWRANHRSVGTYLADRVIYLAMIPFGRWLAASMIVHSAIGGQSSTLEDFLARSGWDSAKKGALIVLDPAHVLATSSGQGLAAFNRTIFRSGSLSAIVPAEMVIIDDNLQEPNLYDGMTSDAKVLFLLATLTKDQLRLATQKGISPSELSGQPRAALESLIHQPFVYSTSPFSRPDDTVEKVSQDKLGEVRLKINRGICFEVAPGNSLNSVMRLDPRIMSGRQALQGLWHKLGAGSPKFGITPKSSKPNEPKRSELQYASPNLSASLTLSHQSTVGDVLREVGQVSHLALFADPRISQLPVEAYGPPVRVSDLLRSLAMAVTGTFRKVGGSYVLTSDIMGLAERQMRFWIWENRSGEKQMDKTAEYLKQIFAGRALDVIEYDKSDTFRPDDALASKISADEQSGVTRKIASSELSAAERESLNRMNDTIAQAQKFDSSHVGVFSKLAYSFVLPDGRQLNPEMSTLSPIRDWKELLSGSASTAPEFGRFSLGKASGPRALMVRVEDPSRIKAIAHAAIPYGFTDLWIQTSSRAVLDAASQTGLKVRFVAEPWKSATRLADPDRDAIGGLEGTEMLADERPRVNRMTLSPLDPSLPSNWDSLKALASVPNVEGVVIADTQPTGYERERPSRHNFYGISSEKLEFGYSTAERESFLKQFGADPIDICYDVYLGYDISQPFFPDPAQAKTLGSPAEGQLPKLMSKWVAFRADLNEACTKKLLDLFGKSMNPPLVRLRRRTYTPDPTAAFLTPWTQGRSVSDLLEPGQADVPLMPFPNPDIPGWAPNPALPSIPLFPEKTTALAFDLREVEPQDVIATIQQWFVLPLLK